MPLRLASSLPGLAVVVGSVVLSVLGPLMPTTRANTSRDSHSGRKIATNAANCAAHNPQTLKVVLFRVSLGYFGLITRDHKRIEDLLRLSNEFCFGSEGF